VCCGFELLTGVIAGLLELPCLLLGNGDVFRLLCRNRDLPWHVKTASRDVVIDSGVTLVDLVVTVKADGARPLESAQSARVFSRARVAMDDSNSRLDD
jgi:hypothetical protein